MFLKSHEFCFFISKYMQKRTTAFSHKRQILSNEKGNVFFENKLKLTFLKNFPTKNPQITSHKRPKMSLETVFKYVIFVIERFLKS